jgi:GNAT superfamily N-acetyltransferase
VIEIVPTTIATLEAAPNIWGLLDEYGAESAIAGMPTPAVKVEAYRRLEAGGLLQAIAAHKDGELIGFITVLKAPMPHYSATVAVAESFFVAKAHRKTGAGLRLLRAAESKALELGSPGLLVSAPFEGDLFYVLPRVGYAETNRIFFKRLGDG